MKPFPAQEGLVSDHQKDDNIQFPFLLEPTSFSLTLIALCSPCLMDLTLGFSCSSFLLISSCIISEENSFGVLSALDKETPLYQYFFPCFLLVYERELLELYKEKFLGKFCLRE